jgi:hypothetical protein
MYTILLPEVINMTNKCFTTFSGKTYVKANRQFCHATDFWLPVATVKRARRSETFICSSMLLVLLKNGKGLQHYTCILLAVKCTVRNEVTLYVTADTLCHCRDFMSLQKLYVTAENLWHCRHFALQILYITADNLWHCRRFTSLQTLYNTADTLRQCRHFTSIQTLYDTADT